MSDADNRMDFTLTLTSGGSLHGDSLTMNLGWNILGSETVQAGQK